MWTKLDILKWQSSSFNVHIHNLHVFSWFLRHKQKFPQHLDSDWNWFLVLNPPGCRSFFNMEYFPEKLNGKSRCLLKDFWVKFKTKTFKQTQMFQVFDEVINKLIKVCDHLRFRRSARPRIFPRLLLENKRFPFVMRRNKARKKVLLGLKGVSTEARPWSRSHLVLPVVRQAAAVLQFGFVLVGVDQLTQVTEVTNNRSDKLGSCKRTKKKTTWWGIYVGGPQFIY